MKHANLITLLIVPVITFFSCEPDEPYEPPVSSKTVAEQFFDKNQVVPSSFKVSATSASTVTGTKGTRLSIPANAFSKPDGSPVTGEVDLELTEIFSKQDIIYSGRPTVAESGDILESDGEFFVSASQNGSPVILTGSMQVEVPDTSPEPSMQLFIGATDPATGNFVWALPGDTAGFFIQQAAYMFNIDTLTWINIDQYVYGTNTTEIQIHLPAGFQYEKSLAYLVFDNSKTVLSLYKGLGQYYSQDRLTIGENITVLMVSEKDGKLYAGKHSTSVTDSQEIHPVLEELSEEQVKALIESIN